MRGSCDSPRFLVVRAVVVFSDEFACGLEDPTTKPRHLFDDLWMEASMIARRRDHEVELIEQRTYERGLNAHVEEMPFPSQVSGVFSGRGGARRSERQWPLSGRVWSHTRVLKQLESQRLSRQRRPLHAGEGGTGCDRCASMHVLRWGRARRNPPRVRGSQRRVRDGSCLAPRPLPCGPRSRIGEMS